MTHELKMWPEFYVRVLDGSKTFDIRKVDRDVGFGVGDKLLLCEYQLSGPIEGSDYEGYYTGGQLTVEVTYITDFAQQPGYVVMAIRRCYGEGN